jgi:hypothetical protein
MLSVVTTHLLSALSRFDPPASPGRYILSGIIFNASFNVEGLLELTDHMMNVALPNDSSDPDEVFTVSSGTEVSGL